MLWQSLIAVILAALAADADPAWRRAEENGQQSQRAVKFARRYASGWLSHADPASGLLPRNVTADAFWNAKDAAADNYPFLVITALMTDDYHLRQVAGHILAQEQKLSNRLDRLPDDFRFATQTFRTEKPDLESIIFGAAEYAKDGLIPIAEWQGPSPWRDRMEALVADIFKHAPIDSPVGRLPSRTVEVMGDLLQVTSRLYWMTGNDEYRKLTFRMADYYLLHDSPAGWEYLQLIDHGSEIIGGLSEACVIAWKEDPARREKYRPAMTTILDRVLEIGTNSDGMLYVGVNPKKGDVTNKGLSDTWGYVYNGFLTLAAIDSHPRYREAAVKALANVGKYTGAPWADKSADGYADSIEGALNLLNRLPNEEGFRWVDAQTDALIRMQRHDGLIEGWHGDGNDTRTVLMYALWKTQGVTAAPWREDVRLGAVRAADGGLQVTLACEWPWSGRLRFDRARHSDVSFLPMDYPRINQWPEWFTVKPTARYEVTVGSQPPAVVPGAALLAYGVKVTPKEPLRLTVRPLPPASVQRTMRYTRRSPAEAAKWQQDLRGKFAAMMKIDDLLAARPSLNPSITATQEQDDYRYQEIELNSTAGRRIRAIVTVPKGSAGPFPAVICIHGHGGNRQIVHDPASLYRGFAKTLAGGGYVTISTDVGQHEVYEAGRTLMGERLWDVIRCVDYLAGMKEVDARRIGCAGLSLGGEMAMWLAAMDERVAATVSSGFLTCMDQMEYGHCMCWKFEGLRELADFADIYGLIAPRALQCQNGLSEDPTMFVVPLARRAMEEIQPIYADLGAPGKASLAVHSEGHIIDLTSLVRFFREQLHN